MQNYEMNLSISENIIAIAAANLHVKHPAVHQPSSTTTTTTWLQSSSYSALSISNLQWNYVKKSIFRGSPNQEKIILTCFLATGKFFGNFIFVLFAAKIQPCQKQTLLEFLKYYEVLSLEQIGTPSMAGYYM